MPMYEYECGGCGERQEFIQKFSDPQKRKCPACGALKLKRLLSAAAFHLKGDGWYVTDFRDKDKKKKDDGKADSKADSKTDGKSDGKSESKSSGDKSSGSKSSDSSSKTTDSKSAG